MNYIIKLLSQPSTYAGLSGIALALGMSDQVYQATAAALAGIFALIAVFVTERWSRSAWVIV